MDIITDTIPVYVCHSATVLMNSTRCQVYLKGGEIVLEFLFVGDDVECSSLAPLITAVCY